MRAFILTLVATVGLLSSHSSQAAQPTAADCYTLLSLEKFKPVPSRELVILIDQTTVFTPDLVNTFAAKVAKTVQPGDRVSLIGFSAVSNKHHVHELATVDVDRMPEPAIERDLPVRRAADLSQCVTLQKVTKARAIDTAVRVALKRASHTIPFSEIVGAFRDIGGRLKASEAKTRVVIVATDGLQHSATLTFYDHKAIRLLDAEKEVTGLRARGLLSDLAGARVYVFGGGLAPPDAGFRDQAELVALEAFWGRYIKDSGGELVAFGKPVPLVDFK